MVVKGKVVAVHTVRAYMGSSGRTPLILASVLNVVSSMTT